MVKRRHMILLSDDDDDDDGGGGGGEGERHGHGHDRSSHHADLPSPEPSEFPPSRFTSSTNKKKKKKTTTTATKAEEARRTRSSGTRKPSEAQSAPIAAEMQDGRNRLRTEGIESWAIKYSPKKISDLAIHSRKVAEVREWLEAKLKNSSKIRNGENVLVLSGPSGVGKTALVRVLVDLLDIELCEWDPPVPTLWKEHLHHVNPDILYMSKMDEFVEFLEKVKKYPLLPLVPILTDEKNNLLSPGATSNMKSKVILIDDLPSVKGRELANKLCNCLQKFSVSVEFPTIVIATDFLETGENWLETSSIITDILQSLESGGARKITFNPITSNAIKKVLNKILTAENCVASSATLSFIAESSGGDIRHAIHSLQFLCLGQNPISCAWDAEGSTRSFSNNAKRRKISTDVDRKHGSSLSSNKQNPFGCRDSVLTVFHALGKVLHNKRIIEEAKISGESSIGMIIKCDLQRQPMNMEEPEIILARCHGEAASFVSFLHENFLEFVDDEAVEDVSVVLAYFSDVDFLLNRKLNFRNHYVLLNSDEINPGNIAEAVAGSIAARGVLFANTHPVKHRWQSIRAPLMRQVDRQLNEKKVELRSKSWLRAVESSTMISSAIQATEWEPYCRQIINETQPPRCLSVPSRETSEVNFDVFEDDFFDLSLQFHEEQKAAPTASMDMISMVCHGIDGMQTPVPYGFDDEIEEW